MSTRLRWLVVAIVILAGAFLAFNLFKSQLGAMAFQRAASKSISSQLITDLDDGLHVFLCGTGSPMSDPSRKGPCTTVIAGERQFVIDIGTGAARNFGPAGLSPGNTEAVLLTHFHSDHIDGLGDFLTQRWASSGADAPLPIYGANGIALLVDGLNQLYSFDQQYRVAHHGEVMPAGGFGGVARPFTMNTEGQVVLIDDGNFKLTAFTVDHGEIEPAVGYRFDYKGRSVVISGDTSQSANLEHHAMGADILIHEALNEEMIDVMREAFTANENPRLNQIFQDIKEIHTTPIAAAESASRAGVDMLVFSHIVPPVPARFLNTYFLRGTGKAFDGKIVMGSDGMLFSLPAEGSAIQQRNLL